ncbi:MAG TPA: SpvB/TcaC N-terminal domain-containing protein, partial [Saprospiraceae bacterium]|nr:SpvB/TcaC N-terminal domain-containing protein [Saprospiraceae bacterium]
MQRNNNDKPSAGRSKPSGSPDARSQEQGAKSIVIDIPQISLPKGGGAIKGIDEKFQVNAANGTASLSLPLPFSPGRNGFMPAIALGYNSGGGNGLFGRGWELSYPSIQRKTDEQLPRCCDVDESDTFMVSG